MHSDFSGNQQTAPWDQIQVFIHVLIKGTDWKVA